MRKKTVRLLNDYALKIQPGNKDRVLKKLKERWVTLSHKQRGAARLDMENAIKAGN